MKMKMNPMCLIYNESIYSDSTKQNGYKTCVEPNISWLNISGISWILVAQIFVGLVKY